MADDDGGDRPARVTVFAPTPLLTITVERPAEDVELHLHAGGQGVWQARMISSLGVPVTLCAAVGGEVGAVLRPLLEAEGVTLRLVDREGGSGWYVDDRRDGERTRLAEAPGAPLGRHELDELYGLVLADGLESSVCVLSGAHHPSLVPDDVYRRLAADLSAHGGRVVADLSGSYVDAALAGGLTFLKVSDEELERDGRTDGDLVAALFDLHGRGAEAVVISRSHEPALALLDGTVTEVEVPRLEEADHHGAGDSMTAGVAAVLARGGDLADAVRTGAAAGALNVTRHGLGTGSADAVAAIAARVALAELPREGP
jgi:1-phosphofructokinase